MKFYKRIRAQMNSMPKIKLPRMSKKVVGCILCMMLVVFASQSRLFDLLTATTPGNIVLLALVASIAYTNKIFGAAAFLFLVLAFGVNTRMFEGMQNGEESMKKANDKKTCKKCTKCGADCDASCKCKKDSSTVDDPLSAVKKKEGMEGMCSKKREGFTAMEREMQLGIPSHHRKVTFNSGGNVAPSNSTSYTESAMGVSF